MTDSTIANLNDVSSHGGVQGDDLFYMVRTGTPDLDFRGNADAILTYIENSATAFSTTGHTHPLADISDAGTLAGLNDIGTTQIQNDAVTYAKIQDVSATDKILGRAAAGSGVIEEITCTSAARDLLDDVSAGAMRTTLGLATVAATGSYADLSGTPTLGSLAAKSNIDLGTGDATGTLAASRFPALSGDVTTTAGNLSATIANNAVTNAKAAQMASGTIKGNNGGSTANASDLTATQVTAMLNNLVGDTGSGGTKGLAPAPSAGDAAAGKFLKADGTWAAPSGSGGTPGGSSTQLQYNSSGTFAGAANAMIDASGNINLGEYTSSNPSAPGSGITLFARKRASQSLPGFLNATNRWAEVSPLPLGAWGSTSALLPGVSGIIQTGIAGITNSTGTSATKSFDGTTFGGSVNNFTTNTSASTGASAGFTAQYNFPYFFRGTLAGTGGFFVVFRFGIDTAVATSSVFIGIRDAQADIGNVNPSTLTNVLGFSNDAGQANMQFLYNDGSGTASQIDLGSSFPAQTSGAYYEARLYCAPNGSTIYYSLERLDTASFTEGSVSSDIPGTTTGLIPALHICNRTTASVAKLAFMKFFYMRDF